MSQPKEVVAGRNCEGCTLCCKLLSIAEIDKPPLVWCPLCDAKAGCRQYAQRPTECRNFYCQYLLDSALDDRWKPSVCKLVVAYDDHAAAVAVHVDPGRPGAWRAEPFHSQIRRWAAAAAEAGRQVVVWQGDRKIVIDPEVPANPVSSAALEPEVTAK